MRQRIESYFEFTALGTNWRTEILAGVTTFMTMAYIVFVNPSILSDAGMPVGAVTAATCLSAAFGSFMMGVVARYPIALAPGMGLNAYFAYSVVKGMGLSWQAALGAVLLSGIAFLLITLLGLRQLILAAVPLELHSAVAAGIGLFIALLGFRNAGIVIPDPSTTVTLGNLHDPNTLLAIFGLLLAGVLMAWRVPAALLIGILATTGVGIVTGVAKWQPMSYHFSDITQTVARVDVAAFHRFDFIEVVIVLLFVSLFDNLGTLIAVGKQTGLFTAGNRIPRLNRILFADASATMTGALSGTSPVVSYIESAAGVAAGGRTGITAVVTGLLFLVAAFAAPVLGVVPVAAVAPALIVVGCLMMTAVTDIDWREPVTALSAFLTMMAIPLTFSIANGLALGFTAYTVFRVMRGEFTKLNWLTYVLAALFLARFIFLGKGA